MDLKPNPNYFNSRTILQICKQYDEHIETFSLHSRPILTFFNKALTDRRQSLKKSIGHYFSTNRAVIIIHYKRR